MRNDLGDTLGETESAKSRDCQNDAVEALSLELLKACTDVASEIVYLEVGAIFEYLRLAAKARGTDFCSQRKLVDGGSS